jgi:hypothetical protein
MFKRVLAIVMFLAAFGLAVPGFARPPQAKGSGAEQAVDVAKATGEEKGKASGEQHGRNTHQNKHRGADR